MADDVTTQSSTLATVPDGTVIATDDVSGKHYQKVKLADGTADSSTVIAAGGGVEAGALRVTVASDSTGVLSVDDNGASLTVDGTVTANAGTGPWPVTDNGGTLTVDDGGTTLSVDDGAGSLTVDDGGLSISIDDGGNTITVDGTVGVSGTVTVDSELTTGDLDTGAGTDTRAVVGLVGSKSGGGEIIPGDTTNGLDVDVTRVQGTVTVDGSGVTQPVSGTVTVQQSTASNLKVDLSGTAANTTAIKVDGSAVTQPVSGTFWQATQPVSGTVTADTEMPAAAALADTTANPTAPAVGSFGHVWNGTTWDRVPGTAAAGLKVQNATASNLKVDLSGTAANTTPILVTQSPATSGGLTTYNVIWANNATGIRIKNGAGQVYGWVITNTNAAVRYCHLYNSTSNGPTSAETPLISFAIPGGASGAGIVAAEFTNGIAFGTGIGIICSTGIDETGAPGSNELLVNIFYK